MEGESCLAVIFGLSISAFIGSLIGKTKERSSEGAIFGFLLGPIGWLIIALGPSFAPKCPSCKGDVIKGAIKCKNCGSDLPQQEALPERPKNSVTYECKGCSGRIYTEFSKIGSKITCEKCGSTEGKFLG